MRISIGNVRKLFIALLALFLPYFACASTANKKLLVVTTVAPITNIVQNVGAPHIDLIGIVPDGNDSHTFEPIPTDAKTLRAADIIIVNGLDLELPTVRLAEKIKKAKTPILQLGNQTLTQQEWQFDFSYPREKGYPNPHLWLNIALVMRYVEIIRDSLSELDPINKASYFANAAAYRAKLEKLDNAIFDCIATIPSQNRKLVTYHDSFAYFAPRYGMTVIAALQPADFSEPGPQEVIRIVKQIKKEKVPAIFGSEVFPSKVMAQIAREANVKFVDQLSDDALPAPPNDSFIGMMVNNLAIMAEALGGDPACLANIDASNLAF